jgi:hypothetical protein
MARFPRFLALHLSLKCHNYITLELALGCVLRRGVDLVKVA